MSCKIVTSRRGSVQTRQPRIGLGYYFESAKNNSGSSTTDLPTNSLEIRGDVSNKPLASE